MSQQLGDCTASAGVYYLGRDKICLPCFLPCEMGVLDH